MIMYIAIDLFLQSFTFSGIVNSYALLTIDKMTFIFCFVDCAYFTFQYFCTNHAVIVSFLAYMKIATDISNFFQVFFVKCINHSYSSCFCCCGKN